MLIFNSSSQSSKQKWYLQIESHKNLKKICLSANKKTLLKVNTSFV